MKIGKLVVVTVVISDKITIWQAVRPLITKITKLILTCNQYTTILDKK